jgi:hypothetical protein
VARCGNKCIHNRFCHIPKLAPVFQANSPDIARCHTRTKSLDELDSRIREAIELCPQEPLPPGAQGPPGAALPAEEPPVQPRFGGDDLRIQEVDGLPEHNLEFVGIQRVVIAA